MKYKAKIKFNGSIETYNKFVEGELRRFKNFAYLTTKDGKVYQVDINSITPIKEE